MQTSIEEIQSESDYRLAKSVSAEDNNRILIARQESLTVLFSTLSNFFKKILRKTKKVDKQTSTE